MAAEADRVYAVTEFHNCEDQDAYYQGTLVVAIYGSRQTAEQHADREGLSVMPMEVRSKLRTY